MSDVKVTVGADTSALSSGLAAAHNAVEGFKEKTNESLKEVGSELTKAFAVGAVLESIKALFEKFSEIQNVADRFGTSAESVQRLGQVAKESGSSLEGLTKSLAKSDETAKKALQGDDKLAGAYKDLGIDAKEFIDMPLEERMLALADAFEKSGNNPMMRGALRDVLGKSAGDLIPVLQRGKGALEDMFKDANVASNETVAKMKETSARVEHLTESVKAFGAEAIGWLMDRIEALGTAAAMALAFITNLGNGWEAAKKAADDTLQAAADLKNEEAAAAEAKAKRQADNAKVGQKLEDDGEAKEQEKELGELQKENAKKQQEYHLAHITLLQREMEIRKRIAELDAADKNAKTEADKLKIANERYDLIKEDEKNIADLVKQQAEADKQRADNAKKQAEEKARVELEAKKSALEKAEENLKKVDKTKGFSVDSLRAIGGGIGGVNYGLGGAKNDLQRQQVDYARQQVELLKSTVKALEAQKANISRTSDGSFSVGA